MIFIKYIIKIILLLNYEPIISRLTCNQMFKSPYEKPAKQIL